MFRRLIKEQIKKRFFQGKAIILTGARQTGKTTLSLDLLSEFKDREVKTFNGDNPTDRAVLNNKDLEFLTKLIGEASVVFIDEGQKIPTIGQTIKLLVDHFKEKKQILITGSSGFNLLSETEEALTGRKWVFTLYPLSLEEIIQERDQLRFLKELETILLFGSYPEIASQSSLDEKRERLKVLTQSYLFKDILELYTIKSSETLEKLVTALALQIGSEVSATELASLIGINKNTVDRYLHILEENHIIFKLPAYTKNKRREIGRRKKIYFWDLGIRNCLINNFNLLAQRNDGGALWENMVIAERIKYQTYHGISANNYFWRTYDGSEIDFVEEREDKLFGYEIKWGNKKRNRKAPEKWAAYKQSSFDIITPERGRGFLF